jgi:hypothetical protein
MQRSFFTEPSSPMARSFRRVRARMQAGGTRRSGRRSVPREVVVGQPPGPFPSQGHLTWAGRSSVPGPGRPVTVSISDELVRVMQKVAAKTALWPMVPGVPVRVIEPALLR